MIEYDIFRTGLGAAAMQIESGEGTSTDVLWQNGATIARTGVGTYTLTLDQFAGVLSAAPMLALISSNLQALTWSAAPDAAGRVWTFSLRTPAGVLADPRTAVLALLILNIGRAGQNS